MSTILRPLVILVLSSFSWCCWAAQAPTVESVLAALRNGDTTAQANAVGKTLKVDPNFRNSELKQAVDTVLANPVLVDHLFFDRGEFFGAVVGYFPELLDVTNGQLMDAIESDSWRLANMGFYFLRLRKKSPSLARALSPKLVVDPFLIQAVSLHFGQIIESGKTQDIATTIPMINAITGSPLVTADLVVQTADLMLLLLRNARSVQNGILDYVLGRMEELIAESEHRRRLLGVAKVIEVYEALKRAGGVATRNPFDSTDNHVTHWLRQHQLNYDLLPQQLDYVLNRAAAFKAQSSHFGANRPDGVYNAWSLIEQSQNVVRPERIREFLEQRPEGAWLGGLALVSAPIVLRRSGYVLPLSELYHPVASYTYGLIDAVHWSERAHSSGAELAGVVEINGAEGLANFVDELKTPPAKAQAAQASAEELRKAYVAEARANYREMIYHSLATRFTRMFNGQEADQIKTMEWILRICFQSQFSEAPTFGEFVSDLYLKLFGSISTRRQLTPAAIAAFEVLKEAAERPYLNDKTRANLLAIQERYTHLTTHPFRRKAQEVRERIRQLQTGMGMCRQTVRSPGKQ